MRRTDVVVSNKKFFSNSGGLGPANVGTEEWTRAKERQERMQQYLHANSNNNQQGYIPAQPIYMKF
jgi:hypothetical protein